MNRIALRLSRVAYKAVVGVSVAFLLLAIPGILRAQSNGAEASPQFTRPVTHYTLPPDKLAKSTALHKTHLRMWVIDTAYGFAVLLAFLYGKWTVKFRDIAEQHARNSFVQALIFVPLFLLVRDVLHLLPGIYGHHISLSYGLSVQRWLSWFADWLKAVSIEVVVGIPLIWLFYFIIRRSPRRWWFYFWLATLPIIGFFVFIMPLVIDPMFNKFEPLDRSNPALVTKIEELAHHAGQDIPRNRIFEMKASAKTTELNAYVTGYGTSKRVVLWDTTEQKMNTPQTLFVIGHEMGHYVLGHVWKGMLFAAALLFVVFYLLYRGSRWLLARKGQRWGIREVGDYASLPALFLVGLVLAFFADPVGNAFSRMVEHHADIYGIEVIHGIVRDPNQAAAQSFQILGETSLSYPYTSRALIFWTADHPSIPDRVRFAATYNPWAEGKAPQFVK